MTHSDWDARFKAFMMNTCKLTTPPNTSPLGTSVVPNCNDLKHVNKNKGSHVVFHVEMVKQSYCGV